MIFLVLILAFFTAVYALMLASAAWEDILTGLVVSSALVFLFRAAILPLGLPGNVSTLRVMLAIPRYLWMMARDILVGTVVVAERVVGLKSVEHPGIIKVPIGDHTPAAVGIAGLALTLSPGSFLVDVNWDERVMLVHVIDATNWQKVHDDMLEYLKLLDAVLNPDSKYSYPELPGGGGT
jgi:multisubunit Na+/H+ antiporter MnhE subunit